MPPRGKALLALALWAAGAAAWWRAGGPRAVSARDALAPWDAVTWALRLERETPPPPVPRPVDPNTATAEELVLLPGIGPVTAARILADRVGRPPYRSAEDLTRVKGIGAKTAEKLAPWLLFPPREASPGRLDTLPSPPVPSGA